MIRPTPFRIALLGSTAALALVSWSSVASATTIDLSGFATTTNPVTTNDVVINADLTLRALTNIGQAALPNGKAGVVYFLHGSGAGVTDSKLDKKSGTVSDGSTGISGGGGDADEALVFLFGGTGVSNSDLKITLNEYEFVNDKKKGIGWIDDELTLLIKDTDGDTQSFTSAIVEGTFIPGDSDEPVIDLSLLALAANIGDIAEVTVTGTLGHFVVKGLEYSLPETETRVPEPATLAMFGIGLAGLGAAALRRRRSK